jgi:putative ABC transport system permease protein
VLAEGVWIATIGIAAGAVGGYALARTAVRFVEQVQLPGILPVLGAAIVLIVAAAVASLMPAARASRVDVLQALRSE